MIFKTGDQVVCVNNTGAESSLTLGKIYTIIYGGQTLVTLQDDQDDRYCWHSDRFKSLLEQKEPQSMETKQKEDSGGGVKFDAEKPSLELLAPSYWWMVDSIPSFQMSNWYVYGNEFPERLPYDAVPILEHGRTKYGSFNWLKGMAWGRFVGAFHRHCNKLKNGLWVPRDLDELDESGYPHGAHAECNRLFLLEYEEQRQRGHLIGTNDCFWANK